ncbi:hypothetical protein EDD18DRAFT_154925 [Armillaria luteobubalina]|uniref:Secreted protein n=1 Tax=Armillaria luteobubalina TaxID=153913 RepID=A0AA39Q8U0_9AGAR|nr:hypothetical protein EDD18DRAFT_154925 [Armillaria luteobubalina]
MPPPHLNAVGGRLRLILAIFNHATTSWASLHDYRGLTTTFDRGLVCPAPSLRSLGVCNTEYPGMPPHFELVISFDVCHRPLPRQVFKRRFHGQFNCLAQFYASTT